MRKVLLAFCAMTLCFMAAHADDFVIVKTNSQTNQFAADNIERINFGEEGITLVDKSGAKTAFNYDDVAEITVSGVKDCTEDVADLSVIPGNSKDCEVYNLSGYKMNPNALQPGVYIAKRGTKVGKFVKR